jgi:DTW domain-containing protein
MTRRLTCPRCLRPQAACICRFVTPTVPPCEVLILQHPLEEHHAKNSARLLHLSLPGSRMAVGEAFDGTTLAALMPEPKYTVLLYPPTTYEGHAVSVPLDAGQVKDTAGLRLVVLDATWRKSRKMLHLSPALQRLPRLVLNDVPAGCYAIRKAHKPGQLSTLEATCAALAQLEADAARWQPLLAGFDRFVAEHLSFIKKIAQSPCEI